MLLSAVSVLVVAQSSSEIPEELMNNPVFQNPYYCTNLMNCLVLTLDIDLDGEGLAGAHRILGLTCVCACIAAFNRSQLQRLFQTDDVSTSRTFPYDFCWGVGVGDASQHHAVSSLF